MVLLGNTPMLRLLQRYGWVLAAPTEDFSVAFLEISAIGGMPGWPSVSAGRRVLVERRGWSDDEQVAALRSAGKEVRQCSGPFRKAGRACPLVTSGRCRLAEEADVIVSLLPAATRTAQPCWQPTSGAGRTCSPGRWTSAALASPGLRTCRSLRPGEGTWIG